MLANELREFRSQLSRSNWNLHSGLPSREAGEVRSGAAGGSRARWCKSCQLLAHFRSTLVTGGNHGLCTAQIIRNTSCRSPWMVFRPPV